jgi:hypothetical protein
MTRGERRYRTRRAIDRRIRRYLNQFGDLVDGCYPCQQGYYVQGEIVPNTFYIEGTPVHKHRYHMTGVVWEPILDGPPHKYHKKSIIDRFSDPWVDTRPDCTPKVTDWDDEPVCFGGSQWCDRITSCTCDACAYLEYISFDPFDDPYDLSEWILWEGSECSM